jgi:5-methylcytosine-specific restriction endonuclease McrA
MKLKGIEFDHVKARPKRTNPLYKTKEWRSYRKYYLAMNPICVICNKNEANTVDHIQSINMGGDFWNPRNHQALCQSCHSKKSNSDKEYYGVPRW